MSEDNIIWDVMDGESNFDFDGFGLIMGEYMKGLLVMVRAACECVGR